MDKLKIKKQLFKLFNIKLANVVQLRTKINSWGSWILFQNNNSRFVLNSWTNQPSLLPEVKQYSGGDKYIQSARLWEREPQSETTLCSAVKKEKKKTLSVAKLWLFLKDIGEYRKTQDGHWDFRIKRNGLGTFSFFIFLRILLNIMMLLFPWKTKNFPQSNFPNVQGNKIFFLILREHYYHKFQNDINDIYISYSSNKNILIM